MGFDFKKVAKQMIHARDLSRTTEGKFDFTSVLESTMKKSNKLSKLNEGWNDDDYDDIDDRLRPNPYQPLDQGDYGPDIETVKDLYKFNDYPEEQDYYGYGSLENDRYSNDIETVTDLYDDSGAGHYDPRAFSEEGKLLQVAIAKKLKEPESKMPNNTIKSFGRQLKRFLESDYVQKIRQQKLDLITDGQLNLIKAASECETFEDFNLQAQDCYDELNPEVKSDFLRILKRRAPQDLPIFKTLFKWIDHIAYFRNDFVMKGVGSTYESRSPVKVSDDELRKMIRISLREQKSKKLK